MPPKRELVACAGCCCCWLFCPPKRLLVLVLVDPPNKFEVVFCWVWPKRPPGFCCAPPNKFEVCCCWLFWPRPLNKLGAVVFVLLVGAKRPEAGAGLVAPNRPPPLVEVPKPVAAGVEVPPNNPGVEVAGVPPKRLVVAGLGAPKRGWVVLFCCWLLLPPNPKRLLAGVVLLVPVLVFKLPPKRPPAVLLAPNPGVVLDCCVPKPNPVAGFGSLFVAPNRLFAGVLFEPKPPAVAPNPLPVFEPPKRLLEGVVVAPNPAVAGFWPNKVEVLLEPPKAFVAGCCPNPPVLALFDPPNKLVVPVDAPVFAPNPPVALLEVLPKPPKLVAAPNAPACWFEFPNRRPC